MENPGGIERHLGWAISALGIAVSAISSIGMYVASLVYKRFDKIEIRVGRLEDQTIENRTNIANINVVLGEIKDTVRLNHVEEMAAFNRVYDKIERTMDG